MAATVPADVSRALDMGGPPPAGLSPDEQHAWDQLADFYKNGLGYALEAAELGYEVTMVKDATADYSDKEMQAALDVNIPNYASAIVTTDESVESISSL